MRNRYRVIVSITLAFALGFASAFPITDTADKYISKEQEKKWTVEDSKAYALDQLLDWHYKEYRCLVQLWGKESAWRPEAFNKIKVMGKNAGGIPQLLGLDPKTPPTTDGARPRVAAPMYCSKLPAFSSFLCGLA